jgi:hypothetical protein
VFFWQFGGVTKRGFLKSPNQFRGQRICEDGEDIDPPNIWAAFQAIEITFDAENIPYGTGFPQEKLRIKGIHSTLEP